MNELTEKHLKEIKANAPVLSIDQLADLLGIARSEFRELLKNTPPHWLNTKKPALASWRGSRTVF